MTQTVHPFLMFAGDADAAMRLYASLFDDGEILTVAYYAAGEAGPEGSVRHAEFRIGGQTVKCIDSPVKHAFGFTPASSLFVDCTTEAQIDALAAQLGEGGSVLMPLQSHGFSRKFTWLNDRFGVSWQLNLP
jgi:predicted 3-demethylubiquinone-9 3-methyltransferase (glyoxalase superfamily)